MRELLINADFDLSLRPRWPGLGGPAAERRVAELGFHGLLGRGPDDSVLLSEPAPVSFLDYLGGKGVGCATGVVGDDIRPAARFTPFGWNREAAERNQRYHAPTPHPDLEVVRQVNGRRFAAAVERELADEPLDVAVCRDLAEVEAALATRSHEAAWVVKSEHGNAALGNRRLRGPGLEPGDRRFIAALLEEDEAVLVEPWLRRCHDLCVTFELASDGEVTGLNLHQVVNTADGAFIGALFEERSEVVAPWQEELAASAATVACRLASAGYFGPVCLDAFTWDDGEGERLRPLADLNARSHMSAAALGLWRAWGCKQVLYWRLFTTRKLRMPATEQELDVALGEDAFDPDRRRGTLIASPLRLAAGRPHKLGVCFVVADWHDALALEQRFRERFEP